jgi:hypothetical protein
VKVAVIKLGARISFNANDTSGANGEARSICKMLHKGGAEVHIFTKILKKDTLVEDFRWHNLSEYSVWDAQRAMALGYDALVVLNGNVNFFGGAEDPEQLLNYVLLNNCHIPVFYIYCDPELTLKQVWPSVSKKDWASNWAEEDLFVDRRDIIYLSQPFDVMQVMADINGKNEIKPDRVIHFPFEKFPCLNPQLPLNLNPEVDLSYGGTMRGGKREKKMVKFYFGHPSDISVEMFGKIEAKDFDPKPIFGLRHPTFTGAVKYDEMLPKMNRAMAHVVIGDPYYEKINDMAQRAYESIWSSVITFIDADLDTERRVYGSNKQLADFLYVSSREQVSEVIQLLKRDPAMRKQIVEEQIKTIDFDAEKYCKEFTDKIARIKTQWAEEFDKR